jgi:hypothetical protein
MRVTNEMKRAAFPISGRALTKVPTWRLMEALALMVLKGLKTLRILKAFKFTPVLRSSRELYLK